ncbi:MAG TPA: TonB-dependent receptor [Vicinamibacterales bacterium]|nr:TonB-dependent receptor [Vicinamibacterales bacterium]
MSRPRLTFAVALIIAAAVPLAAQIQTGSILVRLTDEQGAAVPGVTIMISSGALVSGSTTGVSDGGGTYRFPSLPPGTYTVKVDLQGFQTVVRENVSLQVGQTAPLDLTMRVATLAETVTVTGASPVVDTTSANVSVNLSEQLLQSTPGGRDIWGLVEYKVPSLLITRPDVGGTSGGLQGTYNARGTSSAQNSQYLNGINVGDPAAIGAAGFYYDFDAFEDIQVSTGAHDITVPTSGVFLNMLTKSGGDRWAGRTTFTWLGDATQNQNIDADLLRYGFRPETNAVDFVSDINVSGGGPLIARKLRMFGSFRDWRVHVNVPAAFSTLVLDKTDITSGLLNLTYQATDKNRITGFWSKQYYKKPHRFLAASNLLVEESSVNEDDVFDVYQLLWNSVVTSRMFLDARVGLNKILFPTYQNTSEQTLLDTATGIRTRNFNVDTERFRDRYQANATANYYVDQWLGGRHEFKFGVDHAHSPVEVRTRRVDDVEPTYNSATGLAQNVTLFATPFFTKTAVDVTALYAQDSYAIKRMTLTGGVRWERLEGYLPAQSSPASRFFPALPREFGEQRDLILWHTAGPRLSMAYDVTGSGRTALKASAGRYYYVISTGGPLDTANPNSNYSQQFGWNDLNGDLKFQPGEQTGTPVISQANLATISFDPDYRRPFTDEVTAGVDRELLPAVRLSVNYTYRREKFPQATSNPGNPYSSTLTPRADSGRDGEVGTGDDGTFNFYNRVSAVNLTHFTNDPTSLQTYSGLELTMTKRMANRWQMLAGYTFSRTRISGVSVNINPNTLINAEGPVTGQLGDRPHQFKVTGTYILPWHDLGVAGNFNTQSGIVVTRQVNTALTVGGTTTVNVEPLGSTRLSQRTAADVRLFKTFPIGHRSIETSVDVNNLTNSNTVWNVRTLSGTLNFRQDGNPAGALNRLPQFLSPAQVYPPRNVRFNVAVRF